MSQHLCTCVEESFTLRSWCNSVSVWAWGIPRGSPPRPSVQRSCWGSDTSPQWGRTWAAAWSWPPGSWSTSSAWRSNCEASWSLARWSQSLVGERRGEKLLLQQECPHSTGLFHLQVCPILPVKWLLNNRSLVEKKENKYTKADTGCQWFESG